MIKATSPCYQNYLFYTFINVHLIPGIFPDSWYAARVQLVAKKRIQNHAPEQQTRIIASDHQLDYSKIFIDASRYDRSSADLTFDIYIWSKIFQRTLIE